MRLSSSVLGVLRGGVATASLMFTVACGTTTEPIQGEPAATLAPFSAPPVAAPPVAAPPIAFPQAPPATLVPSAPIELTPVAPLPPPPAPPITPVTAPRQPRRPNRPAAPPPVARQLPVVSINELPDQLDNIARPCGRG